MFYIPGLTVTYIDIKKEDKYYYNDSTGNIVYSSIIITVMVLITIKLLGLNMKAIVNNLIKQMSENIENQYEFEIILNNLKESIIIFNIDKPNSELVVDEAELRSDQNSVNSGVNLEEVDRKKLTKIQYVNDKFL
jgi:hypothetical protein